MKITAQKTPLWIDEHLRQSAALAAVVERLRHQVSITLHADVMIGETAIRVMFQQAAKPADRAVDPGVLMDLVPDPTAAPPVEQADETVGIGIPVTQEATEVVGDARYRPTGVVRKAGAAKSFDLLTQRLADTLIGIQTQHPVVAGCFDGELFLGAVSRPVALNDTSAQARGQIPCRIRRVRVDHHDLITETHRTDTVLDPVGLVVCDDASRQSAATRH